MYDASIITNWQILGSVVMPKITIITNYFQRCGMNKFFIGKIVNKIYRKVFVLYFLYGIHNGFGYI